MLTQAKSSVESPHPITGGELSVAMLLTELARHSDKVLVFEYDGHDVLPGYHVTEVKSGVFEALDCGANFESWHEIFIELWDVAGVGERTMSVRKFVAIIGKVAERVPLDAAAKLTFEVSDGARAIQLYKATSIDIDGDTVRVHLTQRPASCKPRDRRLEREETPRCGSRPAAPRCCS